MNTGTLSMINQAIRGAVAIGPEEHAAHIQRESAIILDTDALIQHAMAHCESCCRISNHEARIGNDHASRYWSDRAQNLRRVLVDYGALPQSSL